MTRILITGCRHWASLHVAETVIGRLMLRYGDREFVLVHGDCPTGVDAAFEDAGKRMRQAAEPHPADWGRFGKAAGPIRNMEMVEAGAAFCLAVHKTLGRSAGTRGCVELAIGAGIPVWWIASNDCAAVRVRGFRGTEVIT